MNLTRPQNTKSIHKNQPYTSNEQWETEIKIKRQTKLGCKSNKISAQSVH